jgi:phosphohistidine phosphatase
MRHAKSDWGAGVDRDHDRPLNARGRRAARRMGTWLRDTGEDPDLIVASTAERAHATAQRAAEQGAMPGPRLEADLYGASANRLLTVAARLPDEAHRAMLVGHEPTMSETVALLTGASVRFPTATVARIDLRIDSWAAIAPMTGTLIWLLPPRLLDRQHDRT